MTGSTGGTDSAGTPWAGRVLGGTGFDADDGAADPALLAALAEAQRRPSADADAALVRAAAAARWLVPVVAVLDESDDGEHGHQVDKRTDMAVVTLTAPDGRRALPLFTSTAALAAWDPAARPVPVSAARAAQAAVAEGCQVAVVDLAGPAPTELRPSMLWALAQETAWTPVAHGSLRRPVGRGRRGRRAGRRRPPARGGGAARSGRPAGRPGPARRASRRSRSRRSPPGWGSGWRPTASSAPASTR